MIRLILLVLFLIAQLGIHAQGTSGKNGMTSEMEQQQEALYASTKQLNQFFRRFNGEEDIKGDRFFPDDKKYRDEALRKKYIPALFDHQNANFDQNQVKDFIREALKEPLLLNLHTEGWFAEVSAVFEYEGREKDMQLFMQLQPQRKGYEWVIIDVAFPPYLAAFDKDTTEGKPFLHPMSHELEFMNLRKAFQNNPESYTLDSYQPDYLTLFLYDIKRGKLSFKTIKDVKYHFFGFDNWYFEVSNYNRSGMNSGWLISNLVELNNEQKEELKRYIYGR